MLCNVHAVKVAAITGSVAWSHAWPHNTNNSECTAPLRRWVAHPHKIQWRKQYCCSFAWRLRFLSTNLAALRAVINMRSIHCSRSSSPHNQATSSECRFREKSLLINQFRNEEWRQTRRVCTNEYIYIGTRMTINDRPWVLIWANNCSLFSGRNASPRRLHVMIWRNGILIDRNNGDRSSTHQCEQSRGTPGVRPNPVAHFLIYNKQAKTKHIRLHGKH